MEDSPPTLGDGRYVIERQLGAGGMGSVYLARDTKLGGRLVALKVLTTLREGVLGRFRREARLMARLRHRGLIEVYDVQLDGPEPYIAQEYVEGSDLAGLLTRSGPLSLPSSRRLARELAETLAYLHGQGVVHRDLKPSNVMIQPDGRSRLADLGLALGDDSTRLTQEGTMLGTVLYMAPEAARGAATGPAADVFAWGLVIWEAATGRHPFEGAATAQTHLLRLLSADLRPSAPTGPLPEDLARLVTSCLAPRPEDRPADGAALMALLAKPATAPPSLARPPRRRVPVARILVYLVLAGAALGLLARRAPTDGGTPAAPPGPTPPSVACLLDAIRLTLPAAPLPGTVARLRTLDGRLLVERPMRERAVRLKPPPDAPPDLRWSVHRGDWSAEGVASVGPRLLFDAARLRPGRPAEENVVPLPPLVLGGRVVVPLAPASILVFRPLRRPGEPLTLELEIERLVPRRSIPASFLTLKLPFRLRHAAAELIPSGPDALTAVLFGAPAATLRVPLDTGRDSSLTAPADPVILDALGVSVPGGGYALVTDVLSAPSQGARRGLRLSFRGSLALDGQVPLGLVAVDADTVLVAYVREGATMASLVRTDGTSLTALTTAPLGVEPPAWRDDAPPVSLSLAGGGAVLALGDRLVVARPDGSLFVRPLALGPRGRVGALWQTPSGAVWACVLRMVRPPVATVVNLEAQPLPLDAPDAPLAPATKLGLVSSHIDDLLPMGLVPTADGGILAACHGLLVETGPPPLFERRHGLSSEDEPCWVVATDGAVLVVTTTGRVYGVDGEGP